MEGSGGDQPPSVATDFQDTMPTDLAALPTPQETWATFSPEAPVEAKRESFQKARRPKEETLDMGVAKENKLEQPAQESERTPKSSKPAAKVGKYGKGVSLVMF